MEGIAKAKEKAVRFGRKAILSNKDIARLRNDWQSDLKINELMIKYSLSKASIYRLLGKYIDLIMGFLWINTHLFLTCTRV